MRFRQVAGVVVAVAAGLALGRDTPTVGFGHFLPLEAVSETTANASIGDVNGDGFPDIVLAKGRHWPLADLVLLNDGHGHFDRTYPVSDRADRSYTAALVDLDGDGDLDLVVANDAPDDKVVYFNDGHGHFTLAGTFGDPRWPTRNVTVTDLNGDGHPDLIVANRGGPNDTSANQICLNDGHGHFPSCRPFSTASATTIGAADLDGNGTIDLVVPHRDGGQSVIYMNDGAGGLVARPFGPAHSATRAIGIGDLNGDGRPDIVIGDERAGGTFVYFNRGGTFSDPVRVGEIADIPYAIAIVDVNRDGRADIVLGNENTAGAVLINNGSGAPFTVVRYGDNAGAVYGLAVGDLDHDGWPDIVAARSGAPSMVYFNVRLPNIRRPSPDRKYD